MRLVGVAWGEGHIGEAAAVTAGGESGGPCSLRMLVWAVSQIMFFGVLTGIALKKKKKMAKRFAQGLRLAAGGPGCCPSLQMPSQACAPGPHPAGLC